MDGPVSRLGSERLGFATLEHEWVRSANRLVAAVAEGVGIGESPELERGACSTFGAQRSMVLVHDCLRSVAL